MTSVPLHGKHAVGKEALVDDEDFGRVSEHRWFMWDNGYVGTNIKKDGKWRQHTMGRFIMECDDPKLRIDHKNHNRADNRRDNLRICTPTQNSRNRLPHKSSSSPFHGVHADGDRWRVRIKPGDILLSVGRFENEIDAARAYDFYAIRYFGEFACLNFPDFDYSDYKVVSNTTGNRRHQLP